MKVKYLLALALSHHAELLILDEPTSGLDPVSRQELTHIFRHIVKAEGCFPSGFPPISPRIWTGVPTISPIFTMGGCSKDADRETFLRSFDHLKTPEETGPLPLEEIMLRTERSEWDDDAAL